MYGQWSVGVIVIEIVRFVVCYHRQPTYIRTAVSLRFVVPGSEFTSIIAHAVEKPARFFHMLMLLVDTAESWMFFMRFCFFFLHTFINSFVSCHAPARAVFFFFSLSYCRLFNNPSTHNDLTRMIIHRVKNIAGYPESSAEILGTTVPTLMTDLDIYGDGPIRAMEVRAWRVRGLIQGKPLCFFPSTKHSTRICFCRHQALVC